MKIKIKAPSFLTILSAASSLLVIGTSIANQTGPNQDEKQKAAKEFSLSMYACIKRAEKQFEELGRLADSTMVYGEGYTPLFFQLFEKAHQDYLECREQLNTLGNKITQTKQK